MSFNINKRLLFFLSLAFITAAIIGTISHEFGHYMAAKLLGFNAHISYAMTTFTNASQPMTDKQEFWIILAGPLQTMLTGTIGLLLLLASPKPKEELSVKQWIIIFVTLFWLRQPANLVMCILYILFTGKFPENGDEVRLDNYLHLPGLLILIITAIAGIFILSFIVFRFIPLKQRHTFLLSGIIGGISGYIFWLVLFGKVIMP